MNANELMIGDWVYNKHHKKNIQITPYDFFTHGHLPSGRQYFIGEPELVSGRDLEPIPLTPDILEKNGFKEDGEGVYGDNNSYFIPTYQSGFDIGMWETHIEPTKGIGDFSGKLKYVHELQHALKLCGIEKEIIL